MGRSIINENGNKYNRLTVVCRNGHDKWQGPLWLCLCDCGNYINVKGYDIRAGRVKSCGCFTAEMAALRRRERNKKGKRCPSYKHGRSDTVEYVRERARINVANRRALLANAEGSYNGEDIKRIYNDQDGKCLRCRKFIEFDKITVDHIIPITWGGTNYPSNLQLLCRPCNASKGNRHATDYRHKEYLNE